MNPSTNPADLLAIIDKWMDGYDHMGTGDSESARFSEHEWQEDRAALQAAIESLAAHRGAVEPVLWRWKWHDGYGATRDMPIPDADRRYCEERGGAIQYLYEHPPQAQAGAGDATYTEQEVNEAMEVLRGRHGSTALADEIIDDMQRVLRAALETKP